jgi:SAM-dependent methyltransferase
MMFDVDAEAYGRFMGRFSEPLAGRLLEVVDVRPGLRALDVGSGPGALTAPLVDLLGVDAVVAVDPSSSFVEAVRARLPGLDARVASAEQLPFDEGTFDRVLAQLVVHFMTDPVAGLREMRRVAAPGGRVAASVWDMAGGTSPLELFWRGVRSLEPTAPSEDHLPGVAEGQLQSLFAAAGMDDTVATSLTVEVGFGSFEEWWDPYTLGVGPAGVHVAGLDDAHRSALRQRCAELAGPAPFTISATAWCVAARV